MQLLRQPPPIRRRNCEVPPRARSRDRRRRIRVRALRRGPDLASVQTERDSREERPYSGHRRRFRRPGSHQFGAGEKIPLDSLVAEEDSASVRASNLVAPVVEAVVGKSSGGEKALTAEDVMEAIDRGGPEAFTFGAQPATYWLLDPIDGTRGFVKGNKALFVVGLALVVDREIVLGVMGCPHWQENTSKKSISEVQEDKSVPSESGLLMISHVGCGTWTKSLSSAVNGTAKIPYSWTRCFVDSCSSVPEARFCIEESEPWEALPPSALFTETSDADSVGDGQVLVLKPCCGSLCKYLLVASGRGSVYIHRQKDRVIKAWDHASGIICVLEAGERRLIGKGIKLILQQMKSDEETYILKVVS